MKLFGGHFMTTDGKKWAVAFRALSWEDARAIAEPFQVTVDGIIIIQTLRADDREEVPSVSYFATWKFINNRFTNV